MNYLRQPVNCFAEYYGELYRSKTPAQIPREMSEQLNNVQTGMVETDEFSSTSPADDPQKTPYTDAKEIRQIIRNCNSKKCHGPDQIPNIVLKRLFFKFSIACGQTD